MNIGIISGKGGTGKTTVAVSLAHALSGISNKVSLFDCDVEEPNCHLFLRHKCERENAVEIKKPVWDMTKCDGCGKCSSVCRYNAVADIKGEPLFFDEMCKACGLCSYVCPRGAISETLHPVGVVRADFDTGPFDFVYGKLKIGEIASIPVIKKVKENIQEGNINIIDTSPGTGCPVVAVLDICDKAVLVTEPTLFGLHDLKLAVSLTKKMKISSGILINRSDMKDNIIREFAESEGIPVIGRISDKRKYAEAYSCGKVLVEEYAELKSKMVKLYENIKGLGPVTSSAIETKPVKMPENTGTAYSYTGQATTSKEIVVISGKGGTGKTSITAALSCLLRDAVISDCDVDAPDLHLLTKPSLLNSRDFEGEPKAEIDSGKCTGCGECLNVCRFGAVYADGPINTIGNVTCRIDKNFCEGCGFCSEVCPAQAVTLSTSKAGEIYLSSIVNGYMSHALLGIGQETSGKLVAQVRKQAQKIEKDNSIGTIICDGPPGAGCPVIASMGGCDLALIVTEPTVSGVHDMKRVIRLADHFKITFLVVINKADLNLEQVKIIHEAVIQNNSRIIAEVPFDTKVSEALRNGKNIIEHGEGPASRAVHKIHYEILEYFSRQSKSEIYNT